MNGNDDLMFEYLMQMGAMQPDMLELKRKQAMVDTLRNRSMEPMQGQMIGKRYVAPGIANAIAQLGTAYMAGQGQKDVTAAQAKANATQRQALEEMRRRRMMGQSGNMSLMTPTEVTNPMLMYGSEGYE